MIISGLRCLLCVWTLAPVARSWPIGRDVAAPSQRLVVWMGPRWVWRSKWAEKNTENKTASSLYDDPSEKICSQIRNIKKKHVRFVVFFSDSEICDGWHARDAPHFKKVSKNKQGHSQRGSLTHSFWTMFLSETKKTLEQTNERLRFRLMHAHVFNGMQERQLSLQCSSIALNVEHHMCHLEGFLTSLPDRYNQLGPHASWPWENIASSWETLYTLSLSLPFVVEIVHSYYIDMSKLLHLANHADKISKHPASEERKECNTHDLCTHALWKSPSWPRMTGMNVQLWFFQGVGHSSAEFYTCFALTCRL